jgi:glycosyltransferase involved in cell wall biosynthesis
MRHGHVAHSEDPAVPRDGIYHVPSPFEPSRLDRVWPPSLRQTPLVVTLHDLIPAVFSAESMPDPAVRRGYWARAELIRQADLVLSVSSATAQDAIRLLGIRPDKLRVTGGGVSDDFGPPASRDAARAALEGLRPSIAGEYVLYTGGMDYRKNVSGLLEAYAGLATEIRDRYKLVVVGRLALNDLHGPFSKQAESLGITDRVVFTGHVSDEELVLLYQAASLFLFPSLYEGFGLPVVEALACGAPAIAGRNSSLVELVDREEALFDAADPSSIRAALERALTHDEVRERLRAPEIRDRFSWRRIAEATVAAYEAIRPRPRPVRRRRRMLCVAPLPPNGADGAMTQRVLAALADRCDIDLLVGDQDPDEPQAEFQPVRFRALERVSRLRGGYDGTIYWLGNSLEYALPLHVLRKRPGIVVAYNVRLTSLYASASASRPDLEPRGFADVLRSMYGDQVRRPLDGSASLDEVEADRYGVYMAREAIAASDKFLVQIPAALPVARLDAKRGHEDKIDRLPLPLPPPLASAGRHSRAPVGVFAGNDGSDEADRVVAQLAELSVEFALAGEARPHAAGCSAAIAVRGAPSTPGFATFLADCVAEGLPTLLFGLSLGDEERAENAVELESQATDTELRTAILGLDRKPAPISPAEASASVEDVAERLLSFVNDLED